MNLPLPHDQQAKIVRKSNELIEARYRLSIWEQRLIFALLLNISHQDNDFKRYKIRATELAQMWNLASDNSLYQKVQEAADTLVGRTLQLSDDPNVSKTVSWLAYVEYVKGSGEIELEFHSELKSYLLQLKKYYTEYQFQYVVNFRNQYAIRIYELLKVQAFKATEGGFSRQFDYNELRAILDISETEYKQFGHFKARILQPSVEEINAHTDLYIEEVVYGKTGRKITDITFHVKVRSLEEIQTLQLEMEEPPKAKADHPVISRLVELGFSADIAKRYKNKYGIRKIERNIAYTLAKQQEGLVKDVPAYLNKAITEDMGGAWDVQRKEAAKKKKQQTKQSKALESKAEQAHMEKLAAMSGVPLESLLKDKTNN